jgi:hypothetical protein
MESISVLGKIGRPERFEGEALKNHLLFEFIPQVFVRDEGV